MNKTIQLSDVVHYFDKRTKSDEITLSNFVTIDNILPNKEGITDAINLPPKGNTMPAFKTSHVLVGNIRPYLRKIWFADRNGGCSNDVLVFEAKNGYDPRFIYYSLFRNDFFEHMMRGKKGTKMPRGDKDQILEFLIPDLALPTQQKIAQVLSTLDNKIEINKKISAQLETIIESVFDYWFVQFDFPNEKGAPYKSGGGVMVWNKSLKREIPLDWKVIPIEDIVDVKDGTHDSPKNTNIGYPLITSKHLMNWGIDFLSANFISEKDYISINKRSKVDRGDILFSMIGSVGTVYKIEESNINFAIKNVALYKTSKTHEFKNFVYTWLKSPYMQIYIKNVMAGSIQQFIGLGDLRKMPILAPNKQIALFNSLTKSMFERQSYIKNENFELNRLRDWLLPMLMNGQVSLKD